MFLENNEIQAVHILFISFILLIIYFVWKSTEVRREVQPIESIQQSFGAVRRSSSIISNASTISTSTIEENLTNSVEELAQNIFTEATESYNNNSNNSLAGRRSTNTDDDIVSEDGLSEEERIIREMDRDLLPASTTETTTLRNRRTSSQPTREKSTSNENEAATSSNDENVHQQSQTVDDKISIKLKYLNDEIRTVDCFLNESVGNFKRRNFKTELESKLIKLIFNGKLLEDDSKSIQQCGIFSEATVHCLIVQKKASSINAATANQNGGGASRNGTSDSNNSSLTTLTLLALY